MVRVGVLPFGTHTVPIRHVIGILRYSYHVVVSAGAGPAINKTAYVAVDRVYVGPWSVNVVHEAGDSFTLRRVTVNTDLTGRAQTIAVGVVTGQINEEIGMVPFLQQVYRQAEETGIGTTSGVTTRGEVRQLPQGTAPYSSAHGPKRQGALGGAFSRRIVCFVLQNSTEFLKRERS